MRGYPCRICGGRHELPEALAAGLPEDVAALCPGERESRVVLGDEICKLDQSRMFVRGNIELPAEGQGADLVWTVWVELEPRPFKRALALWMRDARVREPAYPGRLATALPLYEPSTVGLPVEVISMPVGVRFSVRVVDDHPLAREQREGAPAARARAWAELLAHA
jgi:hypothetical protein